MAEDLPAIELHCLGTPSVLVNGADAPTEVLWRKHLALLAYLAASPGRTRAREHLLGLLWPEKPQDRARHSLNEAIRRLRVALGRDRLLTRGDRTTLNGDGLDVDADRFAHTVERDPGAAVALWRGEFLEGLAVDDAPPFEDWLAAERGRYRALAVAAHLGVSDAALAGNRLDECRRAAEAALALEPCSEPAAGLLMRVAALSGDTAGALATYHRFREDFVARTGEAPGAELAGLAERIRSEEWRAPAAAGPSADPPLVGRGATHQRLFSGLDAALQGGGRCLVLVGAEGMGKTRLGAECLARAGLRGAQAVHARPLESDHDAPFSTVRALLASGLRRAPGAAGIDPLSRETLEHLEDSSFRPDGARVAEALSDLVRAVAEERPLVLAVDDAHLADDASLGALAAVCQHIAPARLAVVLTTAYSTERTPRALLGLMGRIGGDVAGEVIRLDPLTDDEMAELVRALAPWCTDADDAARLTRRLVYEAGGSPFLAVILLRDLDHMTTLKDDLLSWPPAKRTFEAPLPFSVPELARMAICATVSDLGEDARNVLVAASVGSLALDLSLVRALTDLEDARLEAAIDSLEQRRFLSYEHDRYVLATPLMQRVVRSEFLTPGKRRRFQLRALELLSQREDLESRVLRVELRASIDPGSDALLEALQTARAAREAGAERSARRALAAAERSASHADDEARRALDEALERLPPA